MFSHLKSSFDNRLYSSGISSPVCDFKRALIGFDLGARTSGPIDRAIKKSTRLVIYQPIEKSAWLMDPINNPEINNDEPPIIVKMCNVFLIVYAWRNSGMVLADFTTLINTNPGPIPNMAEKICIKTRI